eukprot:scaffold1099_cov22-Tisochrysis_lutea.AAC.1
MQLDMVPGTQGGIWVSRGTQGGIWVQCQLNWVIMSSSCCFELTVPLHSKIQVDCAAAAHCWLSCSIPSKP